jgi:hypothetical protein
MRGCHDPAGVREVGRPDPRVEVLLSERNLRSDRPHRENPVPLNVIGRARGLRSVVPPDFESSDQASRLGLDWPQTRPTPVLCGQLDEPCLDPLYLFACALQWHKEANASAGWELVSGLRSSGETVQVAAALLAETKHSNLRVLDLACAKGVPCNPPPHRGPSIHTRARRWQE